MRILITGATGFVGRALVPRLQREGHQVQAWVRDPDTARSQLGAEVELLAASDDDEPLRAAVADADGIVNLAGENLFGGRWTEARKRRLVHSRIDLTQRLVAALEAAPRRPRVFVSASAIGYYGDRGDEVLDEASAPGTGFLADLCRDWEGAAAKGTALGARTVILRIGLVLGAEGGALGKLVPMFRRGLGGRLGSGQQWASWIHLDDLIGAILLALSNDGIRGVLNATAPQPVTNRVFTLTLARALGRRAWLPAPGAALRLGLGEAAGALLDSQRVLPTELERAGFRFRYPALPDAIAAVLAHEGTVAIGPFDPKLGAADAPATTYQLRQTTLIDAPLDEVFAFFSRAENLGPLTPSWMAFRIRGEPPAEMRTGTQIDYDIALGGLPLLWRTRIEHWEPGVRFVDNQERGPYRVWWHEHRFEAEGGRTRMADTVNYTLPFGFLGRLVHRLFVSHTLRRIFGFRHDVIARRFAILDAAGSRAA